MCSTSSFGWVWTDLLVVDCTVDAAEEARLWAALLGGRLPLAALVLLVRLSVSRRLLSIAESRPSPPPSPSRQSTLGATQLVIRLDPMRFKLDALPRPSSFGGVDPLGKTERGIAVSNCSRIT